ncbi:GtrA family protein [Aminipila terrae]|uniref:GtrA family protein n=1 Tax=Aminipila terrae TaxID=2697030 RepID=A0A6P1MDZ0_9FIRM|nr:GtrA family protein [Aminipila terrae]
MIEKYLNLETVRFLIVGVLNTIVGSLIMFTMYNIMNCSYWLSSSMNYVLASILSFFLNKYFTFRNKEKDFTQIIKFICNIAICYFIAYGVSKPLITFLVQNQSSKFQENLAMIFGMGLFTILNFLGQKFFTFRNIRRR